MSSDQALLDELKTIRSELADLILDGIGPYYNDIEAYFTRLDQLRTRLRELEETPGMEWYSMLGYE